MLWYNHSFVHMCLLIGTVTQVSNVAIYVVLNSLLQLVAPVSPHPPPHYLLLCLYHSLICLKTAKHSKQ